MILFVRLALVLAGLVTLGPAGAATLPTGFSESVVASGLDSPTAMAIAPDGRLFICEQDGDLRVVDGNLLATPAINLAVNSSGERGLLGVAFDPDFNTNSYVYLYYTVPSPIHNRVSRFTLGGNILDPDSEFIVVDLPNLSSATNHNGGAIHFGTDGKLYVAVGDNANSGNAPLLSSRMGKMLRLNADGTIPTSNPFYAQASGANRAIWARGLRNPFTFAFQPGTGRMHINDVGDGGSADEVWEEINVGEAGMNYRWPTDGDGDATAYYRYNHSNGACAITGGTFYNPATLTFPPAYEGKYFFSDYCGDFIKTLDFSGGSPVVANFITGASSPVDLKVDDNGRLYYVARGAGAVYRVQHGEGEAPSVTVDPESQSVPAEQNVTFTVEATGTGPLSYRWRRNGSNIAGATSASYTFKAHATDDGANYRCVVTNDFGSDTSAAATLTVLPPNAPPEPVISLPLEGARYHAGDTINYAGDATDPEDGSLPDGAFSWTIVFHHGTHTHPFEGPFVGQRSGSFLIPDRGETATDVWYRIKLKVTDGDGRSKQVFRDIHPLKTKITVRTSPAGLRVRVDGVSMTSPVSFNSVEGMIRSIGAPANQTFGGQEYEFVSWSDGGERTHEIATPESATTYTATFRIAPAD